MPEVKSGGRARLQLPDAPLFAPSAVLAVAVLDLRIAGERVPVVPSVALLDAIGVSRVGWAEHFVVATDRPPLRGDSLPQLAFAAEMDDVLIPSDQIADGA